MYTQLQRCLATLLLSSLLLQNCGNPAGNMIDSSDETRKSQPSLPTQNEALERSTDLGSVIPMDSSLGVVANKMTRQYPAEAQELMALTLSSELSATYATPPSSTLAKPHHAFPQVTPQVRDIGPEGPSAVASSSPNVPSYPIAQGQHVSFHKQDSTWSAEVTDVWGNTQVLPVVCAPHQTPEQAIAMLASKPLNQYKYQMHLLDTNQAFQAPRVVYVGALGLRGGVDSLKEQGRQFEYKCNELMREMHFTRAMNHPDASERKRFHNFIIDSHRREFNTRLERSLNDHPLGHLLRPNTDTSAHRTYRSGSNDFSLGHNRGTDHIIIDASRRDNPIPHNYDGPRYFTCYSDNFPEARKVEELSKQAYQRWKEQQDLKKAEAAERKKQESCPRNEEAHGQEVGQTSRGEKIVEKLIGIGKILFPTLQKEDTPVQVAEEDRKMPAKPSASAKQEIASKDTGTNIPQQPSDTVVSRGFVLNSEGKLQPHEVNVPFAASAGYYEARSATVQKHPLKKKEDRKQAAYPTQSNSPVEVEKSVKDYLQEFQKSTPEERTAMQTQGEQLLKDIEALKIAKKESYRGQVETFVTQDVDPIVWNTVLKQQKDTKAEVDTLRGLRGQLVDTLKPTSEVLETAGVQATTNEANEVAYYSSDEDEQLLSSEEMQRRREVFEDVVDGIMEGGPTLGAGSAAKLAGKALKVTKVVKTTKATKAAGKAVQRGAKGAKAAGEVGQKVDKATKLAKAPLAAVKSSKVAKDVAKGAAKAPPAAAKSSEAAEEVAKAAKWAEGVEGVAKAAKRAEGVDKAAKTAENVSKLEKLIINANELTEGKGALSGLGTSPASAINSAIYHSTTAEQGAAIFRSIAKGHMFRDGNKRTAVTFWKEFECFLNSV